MNTTISTFLGLLSVCILLFLSCNSDDTGAPPVTTDGAQLRLENVSPFLLKKVIVEAGGGGLQVYDNLSSGEISAYKAFDYIYRYGFIQVLIADDTLSLQPIDYVGEEQYLNGQYTYVIDITTESEQPAYMILEFKED